MDATLRQVPPVEKYSKTLARYATQLSYDDLSDEVREKAKMHILDTFGNILAARQLPWSKMVIEIVKKTGGAPQSTVIGVEGKYPVIMAALANGTMAHGVDADDSGARPSWAHPGSCIIPAAYATAEAEKSTGEQLIAAVVAGYEVNCRIDSAVYPGLRNRGFHATGVVGTFGAAVAAGKLMNLTEEQMVNALGLAGIQAAGLEEWLTSGDMSKRLHAGKAAMNGALAALLAREGYIGPTTVLEGKYGLLPTHADAYDTARLTEKLGTEYKLIGCKFKPYACCHELCPPITMALTIKKKHNIKTTDITKIRIGLNHVTAENQLKVAETPLHAQNHAAVAVAIALVKGHAFMNEFFEDYRDPEVIKLGKKTEVYTDPEIDAVFPKKIGTRLEIITKDNNYEMFEDDKQPIPYGFIEEKFTALASPQLTAAKIKKTIKTIQKLETLEDVDALSKALS
jgi:2-methylcitrate dehydratase PrpD